MERLQMAMEKARAHRSGLGEALMRSAALDPPPLATRETRWQGLEPIETYRAVMERNRVVTYVGGAESAPYDLLRTRILQQAREHQWRRIALVSPEAGSGKTTTAANLAFCFARQRESKTLVIDLDLRRPGLAGVLGQTCRSSMADVLEGRRLFADVARRYGDNLAFGLGGEATLHSAELLQSRRAAGVLDHVDKTFVPDITLYDLPPMAGSDDALAFLRNVDCALMIVEAERTPLARIDQAERQLAELTEVMGIVLNKCRHADEPPGPSRAA